MAKEETSLLWTRGVARQVVEEAVRALVASMGNVDVNRVVVNGKKAASLYASHAYASVSVVLEPERGGIVSTSICALSSVWSGPREAIEHARFMTAAATAVERCVTLLTLALSLTSVKDVADELDRLASVGG